MSLKHRRAFMQWVGGAALGAGWASRAAMAAAATGEVDLIVHNARVYTVDDAQPKAEAFAVRGGRFVAVGSSADIKSLAGPRTQQIDAKGMTVVPGFIDCHNHPVGTVLVYEELVGNPYEVQFVSINGIIEKLKAKAASLPPDTWVEGFFHDDTKVTDKRLLTAQDLDRVSISHPVVVRHRGGHTSFYNTRALQLAGITKNTPDVMGGTYDKNAKGELNGRVTDRAREVFAKVGNRVKYTPAEIAVREREGAAFISKKFAEYGVTTVHHQGGNLAALQEIRERNELLHRVGYEVGGQVLEDMIKNGIRSGFGDEWLRFGATSEHTVDGSFSERTMAISRPYAGVSPPYQGNLTESQEELNEWVERVHRAGIQLNCHANGDVAIDRVLNAYERALRAFPRPDARPKITHCTLVNPDILRRMKAIDVVPAVFSTYLYYNTDKFHFYGEDMLKWSIAYRSMLDSGIKVATGSDFSPGPFAPLMALQGMVTRKGWNDETWGLNQRVNIDEAIRISTLNGAYNAHEEAIKGSITSGKLADFVMLADDPHTIDAQKIKDIRIMRTVVGGRTVYQV
jgi:predicted amidohydrolase YtcJ